MTQVEAPPSALRTVGTATLASLSFGLLGLALVVSAGQLPGPVSWTPDGLGQWFDAHPVGSAFSIVCAASLVVVAYLLIGTVATTVATVARAFRMPRLGRLADSIATPAHRRLLAAALGATFAVATAAAPTRAGADTPPTAVATMRLLDSSHGAQPPPASEPLPEERVVETPPPARWVIAPGDHLWGLSTSALADSWHRMPTDAEVASYVAEVVALNQDVFVVRGEPDLVLPGQVFVCPQVPQG
jgi:nucleoid-associated protein YgaU